MFEAIGFQGTYGQVNLSALAGVEVLLRALCEPSDRGPDQPNCREDDSNDTVSAKQRNDVLREKMDIERFWHGAANPCVGAGDVPLAEAFEAFLKRETLPLQRLTAVAVKAGGARGREE